jgi:hypothetical protein
MKYKVGDKVVAVEGEFGYIKLNTVYTICRVDVKDGEYFYEDYDFISADLFNSPLYKALR